MTKTVRENLIVLNWISSEMTVDLIMEDSRWKTLNLLHIVNTAFKETLSHLNMRSENFICCILACSSKKIKGLNAQFRGKNSSTNVLSFPSATEICEVKSGSKFEANVDLFELGDIAIAYEVCKKEANVSKIEFEHHVYHLIIHSVLHLLGYDHEEEKNAVEMQRIEVQVLANLGISNPYSNNL
jgi:probable rRNA maturation factor